MSNRVRSHQQLKAKDALEEMIGNVPWPRSSLAGHARINMLDDQIDKSRCAGSGVQDECLLIRESLWFVEARF